MAAPRESGLFFSSLVQQQTTRDRQILHEQELARLEPRETDWHRQQQRKAFELPPLTNAERVFRHGGWWADRQRVRAALAAVNATGGRRERFDQCGCDCVVEFSKSENRHRVRATYCGDRFCTPCARSRSLKIRDNLAEWCRGETVRFVTATIRPVADDLKSCLDHLLKSFVRLRASKVWSDNVRAGAYVVEITRGRDGRHWHVHLHALVIGSYIPQADLSHAWVRASLGSPVIDVRAVRDQTKGVYYVAKYAAKGFTSAVVADPDLLMECVTALRGRRLLGTFGEWRNRGLAVRVSTADDWVRIGRFDAIYDAAVRKEHWAKGVLVALNVPDLLEARSGSRDRPKPPS